MLAGGSVVVPGACGSEDSNIVAGGPRPNGLCPDCGVTAPAGAVCCHNFAAPPVWTPTGLIVQSCVTCWAICSLWISTGWGGRSRTTTYSV